MDWTEKYRPQTLDGVIGNPTAVNQLRAWAKSWESGIPDMRAVVLMGSPGVGKTTSAEALAREMGWGIVEMNASDQRTGPEIERVALRGSMFDTFTDDGTYIRASEGGRKLIVLDEADSLFGNADRGAMPVINQLVKSSRQPVILIVNDFYELSRKSSAIKTGTLQITFKKPQASTVAKALYRIAEAEGVDVDPAAMERIAANANGDMRAAVRNLESLALGETEVTEEMSEGLSARDTRTDMYGVMSAIFRKGDASEARRAVREVDEDPKTIMLWVDENLPYEYQDRGDLVRGYEKLSRADIFMGRVMRRQYYRFWAYANDMMSAGVASARMTDRKGHDRMRFPGYLMKMSKSKAVRGLRASLAMKIAVSLHTSTRRAENDILPYLRIIASNQPEVRVHLVSEMGLEPEELGFLIGKKADSKDVKAVFAEAERLAEERRLESSRSRPSPEPVSISVPPRSPAAAETQVTVKEKEEPARSKAGAKPKKAASGQKSLFDF